MILLQAVFTSGFLYTAFVHQYACSREKTRTLQSRDSQTTDETDGNQFNQQDDKMAGICFGNDKGGMTGLFDLNMMCVI